MAEQIDKNNSVDVAVRMVADRYERAFRKFIKDFDVFDFISYSQLAQDRTGKGRTIETDVPVIKFIDLLHRKQTHQEMRTWYSSKFFFSQ